MWYLEVCQDNSETSYETVFTGLYNTKKEAEDEGATWFRGLKIIKFVPIRSETKTV
ncbi:hypothetical protein pEaSNUABM50_00067 [Erwinia phage pEa_SNUABM_50]|uniref:Uncharacterized protein n=4 Tax=Eneladusvirus BF TaxID=2560751 RepID=A0A7L8ZMZ6_9CAUD|nr:hypothetical protein FDH34_gp069 [Serratia phage BF]QOI71007.1 hypothetical protein pEaSNUABM12_00069 [Erwinia phage pEa_SNUABM_12]QOI71552.1 hypothetical protein pEaSNUABM47_00068 [Erwinia phage pEa_SNUABM_47]QOI72091.1 hypothetical protein pEaSNUABM50_00067 [Erwinia phage pEa_SNUABM_50]QXO11216.1 hypothetical protein pEaSNUABM19_00070 [Erwinia phage pEa_SNUABM_19]QXO11764.1 hypothetical protein pEaSNUABM44_00068 [Erwinia phage pEa_SNUABM_44]QXO12315.1 hypothetical protein pEaSNUABM49_000